MVTLCSLFTANKLAFYFFEHIYASVKIVIMFKVRIINVLFITELVFCNNPKAYGKSYYCKISHRSHHFVI